jgi:hypothetical protein
VAGAAYEYFGADWLNVKAFNFSRNFQPRPFLRYHNFGGPIVKDELF